MSGLVNLYSGQGVAIEATQMATRPAVDKDARPQLQRLR
jgi:hypothetical protein